MLLLWRDWKQNPFIRLRWADRLYVCRGKLMFKRLFGKSKRFEFARPETTACLVCRHVLEQDAPILYVTHDADDGTWQFLCGETNHASDDAKFIALVEAVRIDPSLNELHDMPLGMGAERASAGARWIPFRMDSD